MAKKSKSKDTPALLRPSTSVQIITIVAYTGFAIPISVVAMENFGVLGIAVVLAVIWGWTNIVTLGAQPSVNDMVERLRPDADAVAERTSGNASFDAYRTEMMQRLEKEQTNFEGFIERLRVAKDQSEFDTFMADREKQMRGQTA
ncbi:MAG: DUF2852 domain-containing protein [Pseudomonadota bacterium]